MILKQKALFENIISLLFLQGFNYVLPLITMPYLTRILGIEKYGLVSFALAFIQYFNILVDYGFNLSATRQISVQRDNPEIVSEIFSSVMVIKVILLVSCFILMNSIVFSVERFRNDWILYYICFTAVIGNVLFPVWLFQGVEQLKKISFFNIIARTFITVLLFIFVKYQHDYLLAAFIQCLAVVIAGIIALIYAPYIYPVRIIKPKLQNLKQALADGWPIFISMVSSNILGNINIFLLGVLYTNMDVGYFSIAQKIVWAVCFLVLPIGNATYPRVGILFKESDERAMKFLRKLILIGSGVFISISITLFVAAEFIVKFITGMPDNNIIVLIKVMSFLPLFYFFDNILGTQIMLNRGMDKKFMLTFVMGGLVTLILAFVLIPRFSYIGASISHLFTEIFIVSTMYYFVKKNNIKIFGLNHKIKNKFLSNKM